MLCLVGATSSAFSPVHQPGATSSAFSPVHQPRAPRNTRRSEPAVAAITEVSYAADAPYREAQYDPEAADAFFRKRPLVVLRRAVQLASLSGGFLSSLFLDKLLKREEQKVDQRSKELLDLVVALGPTFIKIGQALSIRQDILPAAYAAGLQDLQDNVPPFSAAQGRAVIERELGIRLSETFSEISLEPIAAASIGQVYRGTLRTTGEEVAVKVQRPQVLSEVALDLFMVRALAPSWQKAQEINTDLVGLIDAYAVTFVNELDYTREAAATTAFSAAMAQRGLGSVTAPEVVPDLSSMHVLTTKWVDGERLSASDADDVPRLCGVALNAYLTMLLDTGTLHCDPHPGNLLRTTDGRLCILDFGMCLEVPTDLQLSLLEFIANLQAENYEDVPDDLVKLSFVPADKIDELRASGLTAALAQTIRIAAAGGGPKGAMQRLVAENKEKYREQLLAKFGTLDSPEATKERQRLFREDWQREMAEDAMSRGGGDMGGVDGGMGGVDGGMDGGMGVGVGGGSTTADITAKVEEMQQQNSNVFAIPDYFVYMSRAFATLEGIGLSADPDYAILKECFPYLAFRLLSDDSPRAQGALRTLLYGTGTELDLQRLGDVTQGLQSYTVSTASVESGRGSSSAGRDAAVEQLASVVLSEEGSYVQSLLLREAAVALDAAARNSLVESTAPLRNLNLPSLPFPAFPTPPARLVAPLGALAAPFTLPAELLRAALELQQLDERDLQRLDNLRILSELVSGVTATAPPPSEASTGAAHGSGGSGGGGGGSGGSGGGGTSALDVPRLRGQTQQLSSLLREASARRGALTRTGVRFGGTLAATQAERLRQRSGSDAQVSDLAARLAAAGATGLESVASAIVSLDESLAARSPGAGTTEAAGAPPPSLKAR